MLLSFKEQDQEVMESCYLGWLKFQALVYSNLPPTTATDYARGLGKLLANGLFCVGAQMAVSSNNIKYFFYDSSCCLASINKTKIVLTERTCFVALSLCLCVCFDKMFPQS